MSNYKTARKAALGTFERMWLWSVLGTGKTITAIAIEQGIERAYMHRLMRRHKITLAMAKEQALEVDHVWFA